MRQWPIFLVFVVALVIMGEPASATPLYPFDPPQGAIQQDPQALCNHGTGCYPQFSPTQSESVPEPSALALFGIGLAAVAPAAAWRRRLRTTR